MIKLAEILDEYSINKPIDKRKMFDTLHTKHKEIFNIMLQRDTLGELLEDVYEMDGTPITLEDIEGYLIDEWDFNEDGKEVNEVANFINQYYKCIESEDIKIIRNGKTSIAGYRYVEIIYVPVEYEHHDGEDCYIILTKF